MTMIPISEKGLEQHLLFCPICGGETDGMTIGVLLKATLPDGRTTFANRGETPKANRALAKEGLINRGERLSWIVVPEGEKAPDSRPCKSCRDNFDEQEKVVKEGGAYFKCKGCNITGAVIASSKLAQAVRKESGILPPEPVGYEFQKCEDHNGASKLKNEAANAVHH